MLQILRGGKRPHRCDNITGELACEPGVKEEGNFLPGATEKLKSSPWVSGSKMAWGGSWGDGPRTCLGSEEGHSLAEASCSAVQLDLCGLLVT